METRFARLVIEGLKARPDVVVVLLDTMLKRCVTPRRGRYIPVTNEGEGPGAGNERPANLTIMVFDNDIYEAVGSDLTHMAKDDDLGSVSEEKIVTKPPFVPD